MCYYWQASSTTLFLSTFRFVCKHNVFRSLLMMKLKRQEWCASLAYMLACVWDEICVYAHTCMGIIVYLYL